MAWVEDSSLEHDGGLLPQHEIDLVANLERLDSEIKEYTSIENEVKSQQEVFVHLGGGYVVSKNQEEVVQFFHRRKLGIERNIIEVKASLSRAQLRSIEHLKEDLPMVDIQEELDQNGNIIGVSLNDNIRHNMEEDIKKALEPLSVNKGHTSSTKQSTNDINKKDLDTGKGLGHREVPMSNDMKNELEQLYEDMEIAYRAPERKIKTEEELMQRINQLAISDKDKREMKRICLEGCLQMRQTEGSELRKNSSNNDGITSLGDHEQLDTNNLLELEVLANEVDSYDDYNITNGSSDELDYSDEDLSDYLLYGGGILEHKLSSDTEAKNWSQRLSETIINLRMNENTSDSHNNQKSTIGQKKSVKFANEVEINEIQNASEDLANHPKKISKFKQRRTKKNNSIAFQEDSASQIKRSENTTLDGLKTFPNEDSNENFQRKPTTQGMRSDGTSSKLAFADEKLDDLVRDYVSGGFDDDLVRTGLIIDNVEDIPKYNDHVRVSDSLPSTQYGNNNNESEFENKDEAGMKLRSYLNDVVEKPSQIPENVESQIFDRQIRDDYCQMRRRISNKGDDTEEGRNVHQDGLSGGNGAPGRVSKFKASRLGG